jgi:cytochrome c
VRTITIGVTAAVVVIAFAFRNEARPISSTTIGRPDPNRFTPVVLVPNGELDEPMVFEVRPNGKAYIIERKGAFKVFDPATNRVRLIATIPVNTKYTSPTGEVVEAEEGLIGLTFHPDFDQNGWIYLMYAHPTISKHLVSRWELRDDQLVASSERVLIEYPTQRETCCHTGGGMAWDASGNLYIAVGNNSGNVLTGQTDERPGRTSWDDQRSSGNTNDLRGKLLRIHPEPDGTYTIPPGNLFPPGTPATRPEIYAMGLRNPWRVSIDSRTGFVYWGEPGPDQYEETDKGPIGYDEFNQAKAPGNFGWPYFIGENRAIPYFDFVENRPRDTRDPKRPTNTSVNNTGLRELPPAQPSFIEYPYSVSPQFPEFGAGARSAVGGPIYRAADFRNAVRRFPAYYEGKWFIADFVRNWIFTVAMDQTGNLQSIERFLPSYKPVEIIDLKFGPEGDLYLLEYGSTWFNKSPDSQLVRIEYNGSNRAPVVQLTSDRPGAALPARIAFSSAGTNDPDGDPLTFGWTVAPVDGGPPQRFTERNPTVTLDRPGVYTATLTVSDPSGAASSGSLRVIAGNEPPSVGITISGNKSLVFPDVPLRYTVSAVDGEDGPIADDVGRDRLAIGIDYVSEDFDIASIRSADQSVEGTTGFSVGRSLMADSTCAACHQLNRRSIGPSFIEIANRYRGDDAAPARLATKVREGGSGVWGQATMPAHSSLSVRDALSMVRSILSTGDSSDDVLPLSGTHTHELAVDDDGRGALVIWAVYSDNGAKGVPAHTAHALAILRGPTMSAGRADVLEGVETTIDNGTAGPVAIIAHANSYIAFKGIDLTGVRRAEMAASAPPWGRDTPEGAIEIRLGSPAGPLLARADVVTPTLRSGDGPATPPAPITVALQETQGVHDVYFVFKNDRATPMQSFKTLVRDAYFVFKHHYAMPTPPLMILSTITWSNK